MRKIILDGNILADETRCHDYLKEMLELPDYYGKNSDALHDCLTDLQDLEITVINERDNLPCYKKILRVLKIAAKENETLILLTNSEQSKSISWTRL